MGLFNLNKKSLSLVLEYILEHEHDDFVDNLSREHIFYHALVCAQGQDKAENYYLEVQNVQSNVSKE